MNIVSSIQQRGCGPTYVRWKSPSEASLLAFVFVNRFSGRAPLPLPNGAAVIPCTLTVSLCVSCIYVHTPVHGLPYVHVRVCVHVCACMRMYACACVCVSRMRVCTLRIFSGSQLRVFSQERYCYTCQFDMSAFVAV